MWPSAALVALSSFFGLALSLADARLSDSGEAALGACDSDGHGSLSLLQAGVADARALLSSRPRGDGDIAAGPFAKRKHCHIVTHGAMPHQSQCYPDLMLIGNSKCGSTSIAAYMLAHPQMVMQTMDYGRYGWKLDDNVDKNIAWESNVFDKHTATDAEIKALNWGTAPLIPSGKVGDYLQLHYRPNYFYYPDAPFHIADIYPNAKSIKYFAILREPVARAVSSWKFHRASLELRSFERVVDDGIEQRRVLEACYKDRLAEVVVPGPRPAYVSDLPADLHKGIVDACFWNRSDTHDHTTLPESFVGLMHAHVDKGVYVDAVRRWFSLLGRENFFIFSLEEWSRDPASMYTRLADFAGYEAVGPHGFGSESELDRVLAKEYNDGGSKWQPAEPSAELKGRLADYYKPYDEELFELLGRRLW